MSHVTRGLKQNEGKRLAALRELALLDTAPEREFDDVVRIAAALCGTPIALISLVARDRQWFKARIGLDLPQTERYLSFCSVAIETPDRISVVDDTFMSPRFMDNELVTGPPHIRSYAGAPIVVDGFPIGALCVVDTVARTLTEEQLETLAALARGVVTTMKQRRVARSVVNLEAQRDRAERDLSIFSSAIECARDAILILSRPTVSQEWPRIAFANDAYGRLVGRNPAGMIGLSPMDIGRIEENADAIERFRTVDPRGIPTAGIAHLPHADGSSVEVEFTISALPPTIDGTSWVAILRDVKDRRAAEEATLKLRRADLEYRSIATSERRYRELFDRTPAIFVTVDRDLHVRSIAGGGLKDTGLTKHDFIGKRILDLLKDGSHPEVEAMYRGALAGENQSYENDVFGRHYQMFLSPSRDASGEIDGVAGMAFDRTDFVANSQALAATEKHLARTERTAQVGTWSHDSGGGRITYSAELRRMFGLDHAAATREHLLAKVGEEDRECVRASLRAAYESGRSLTLEYRIDVAGTKRWIRESVEFTVDAERRLQGAGGIVVDITERRAAELEIARRADTDPVTSLPNRAALVARIDRLLTAPRERGRSIGTLMLIDLDRFRSTNDSFGYAIGDRLLRTAAKRIGETVPEAFVTRLEGDAFSLLLPMGTDANAAAAALHNAFGAPFHLDRFRLFVTVSIGFAEHEMGDSDQAFLRKAETAVYAAKGVGGNVTVAYDDEIALRHRRRVSLDRDMRGALERREFSIVYQPIVDAFGEIARVEALLRWNHPERGMISPAEFIPIAEDNGEIVPIGRWVLQTACAHLRVLRSTSRESLRLAVNVSARQFADPELLATIDDALRSSELDPTALELEITESTIVSDLARAAQLLAELRSAGVTISIDDFGTGFSSLASLRRLPIDSLKIDRSFIAATPSDADACAIVDAILALARQLSLEVVAEGVESREQADFLRERGCQMLQGYYFARPATPAALMTLIAAEHEPLRKVRQA